MKWEELSMRDRTAIMAAAVRNGYTDIRSIKEAYANYLNQKLSAGNRYAKGGDTDEPEVINLLDTLPVWKALKKISFDIIPDVTFTRDKTGEGDIEYFAAEHPVIVTNKNAYGGNLFDEGGKKKSRGSSTIGERMNFIEQELIKRNVPPVQARAVAANVIVESGGNPNAINPTSGAKGLVQLLGSRKRELKSWSMEDLLDYIARKYNNLGGNEWLDKEAWKRFNETTDPAEAARLFRRYWERPEKSSWYATDKYFGKSYLPEETNSLVQQMSDITWDDVQARKKRFELTPEEERLYNSKPTLFYNADYADWNDPTNSKTFEQAYAPYALNSELDNTPSNGWALYNSLLQSQNLSDPLSWMTIMASLNHKTAHEQKQAANWLFNMTGDGGQLYHGLNFAAHGGNLYSKGGDKDKRITDQEMEDLGWHWGGISDIRPEDPLAPSVKGRDDEQFILDENGNLVSKDIVEQYINSIELPELVVTPNKNRFNLSSYIKDKLQDKLFETEFPGFMDMLTEPMQSIVDPLGYSDPQVKKLHKKLQSDILNSTYDPNFASYALTNPYVMKNSIFFNSANPSVHKFDEGGYTDSTYINDDDLEQMGWYWAYPDIASRDNDPLYASTQGRENEAFLYDKNTKMLVPKSTVENYISSKSNNSVLPEVVHEFDADDQNTVDAATRLWGDNRQLAYNDMSNNPEEYPNPTHTINALDTIVQNTSEYPQVQTASPEKARKVTSDGRVRPSYSPHSKTIQLDESGERFVQGYESELAHHYQYNSGINKTIAVGDASTPGQNYDKPGTVEYAHKVTDDPMYRYTSGELDYPYYYKDFRDDVLHGYQQAYSTAQNEKENSSQNAFGGPLVRTANNLFYDGGFYDLPEQRAYRRAVNLKAPYTNYEDAVDMDDSIMLRLKKFFDKGVSNCTLTVSQLYGNPIGKANTIVTDPQSHNFYQIDEGHIVPGTMVIASHPGMSDYNPEQSYHTMVVTGFAPNNYEYTFRDGTKYQIKKGEPLVSYSRGKASADNYVHDIPLSVYNANSEGKTYNRYYRPIDENYPQVMLGGPNGVEIVTNKNADGGRLFNS